MSEDQTDGSPVLPEVTESKVEATHRLQKEVRWDEANEMAMDRQRVGISKKGGELAGFKRR